MEGEQSGNGGNITNLILMPSFVLKLSSFIIAIQFGMNIVMVLLSSQVMYYLSESVGGAIYSIHII